MHRKYGKKLWHLLKSPKSLGLFFLWFIVVGSILFFSFFLYIERSIPDPESIASRQIKESTKIYDRTGKILLYDIYGEERRTIVPWEQISQDVKNATLASEDNNFYNHGGLDFRGIIRALLRDIQTGSLSQGGSTITQQLVKNALLGKEKTPARKLRELILAIKIERQLSKDQIFWLYLNQIPYGSNAYGVEAASQTFFGKSAAEINLSESALLTALIKAPSYYSPYGNHVPELLTRRNNILKRMLDLGYIDQDHYTLAIAEAPKLKPNITTLTAPHFVIMAREYLIQKYGKDIVESEGFKITTTLDAGLQKTAEDLTVKYSEINKNKYQASNAALVAIDPRTGEVLALVGSSNYFDVAAEGNFNVATAKRQPGSAFKPFAYAVAFQKGYPDSTVLFDLKTEFNPNCSPDGLQSKDQFKNDCYHPQNYDGLFHGPVSMRQALAQSLNIPSVETLYLAGIDDTIDLAQQMGITTLADRSRLGLSLVLGGAEVRLVDLVSAYGVFAADGMRTPWSILRKVELGDGTVLEENHPDSSRVLTAQAARLVTDVLSDNNARAGVFGYNSSLYIPGRDVAAKTGTTQENRDAWVVGYTPSLAVGVWTGNNNNTSMTRAGAGISASGPLWHEFLVTALGSTPNEPFLQPDPVQVNKPILNGNFRDSSPDGLVHSVLYYVNRYDPLGPIPSTPALDSQFANWEWTIRSSAYGF